MRLMLVEDDLLLGDGIRSGLALEGYTVEWLTDGAAAHRGLQDDNFALIILDLGLPNCSGIEVLRKLRARSDNTPVLILTARDTVANRVEGLDTGADDYLLKPFDLDELCARIRALIRRAYNRASPLLVHGAVTLDPASHVVLIEGIPVDMSPREFAILYVLMENAGKVLSRERLEETLYGWNAEIDSNAVEVYVHRLRKKLGSEFIRTVRGVGYLIAKDPACYPSGAACF